MGLQVTHRSVQGHGRMDSVASLEAGIVLLVLRHNVVAHGQVSCVAWKEHGYVMTPPKFPFLLHAQVSGQAKNVVWKANGSVQQAVSQNVLASGWAQIAVCRKPLHQLPHPHWHQQFNRWSAPAPRQGSRTGASKIATILKWNVTQSA